MTAVSISECLLELEQMNNSSTDLDWDKHISALDGGVLQSAGWAEFQQAVGRPYTRRSGDGWAWQAFERRSKGIRYLFSPYGPVVQKNAPEAIESILMAARERGMDFVRLEPIGAVTAEMVKRFGGHLISEVEPACTALLDLTKSEEELKSGLSSGHRNLINGTTRRGIVIEQTMSPQAIREFLKMLRDTAERARVNFYEDDYYIRMLDVMSRFNAVKFYIARVEGALVSAAIFYDFDGTRYYAHAGAYQELNRQVKASVSLVWKAIIDAKMEGKAKFDFWGVAPTDDASHAWAGITTFKLAFGAKRVTLIGTWDIPINKVKYKTYSAYRKLRRMD